jgi:hypothetical protein
MSARSSLIASLVRIPVAASRPINVSYVVAHNAGRIPFRACAIDARTSASL